MTVDLRAFVVPNAEEPILDQVLAVERAALELVATHMPLHRGGRAGAPSRESGRRFAAVQAA